VTKPVVKPVVKTRLPFTGLPLPLWSLIDLSMLLVVAGAVMTGVPVRGRHRAVPVIGHSRDD
jgi:hypothetical protein